MPLKSSHNLISKFGKENLPEILHHIATRLKKLYNCKTSVRDCVIVRATEIEKKEGVPDKLQLMQTIEKYGKNIYDTPLEILQQKMWT